ncbi:uncharacterized protein KY384_008937 [Bacidia gigantensis]|uniref:uncharacterized protein n=1 Tax=Bacidia gigantensis TaxID=2732470 RepID=UPI001D05BA82|nr:uncharacterized protein KY384_008937 [Bacidia gigantensis]KAG8525293.1 hypothetical protein KY384_008937 [Bacidia gigantensis]
MANASHKRESTPTGELSRLPPEVRVQVYSHLFSHIFPIYGYPFWKTEATAKWEKPPVGGFCYLALLRCSKIIRKEATPIFFRQAIFRFSLYPLERPAPALPGILIDRMKNVDIMVDLAAFCSIFMNPTKINESPAYRLESLCKETINNFTGNTIQRKACKVTFCGLGHPSAAFGQNVLTEALRHLTGFEQVTVEIDEQIHSPLDGQTCTETRLAAASVELATMVRAALSPRLGPAEVNLICNPPEVRSRVGFVFKPQARRKTKGKGMEQLRYGCSFKWFTSKRKLDR